MKKSNSYIPFLILIVISLFVSACHSTHKVERRGGYLLVRNTIKYKNPYLPSDELEGFLQQKAMEGRLTPYFRPGVLFHEKFNKGKDTKLKSFIRKSFGKEPIILDTVRIAGTVNKLNMYLKNKGFYHSKVSSSIKYVRSKATVTYSIHSGLPCIVDAFTYFIPDSSMNYFIMSDTVNGKLRKGMIYDTYILDDERERIATTLRNNGYFNFSLSDIYYLVDTANAGLSANVEMHIKKLKVNTQGSNGMITEIIHPRYSINNIYIIPDADINSQLNIYDTLAYSYHLSKIDTTSKTIYILYNNKLSLKPSFLTSNLRFSQQSIYSQLNANKSYKSLISHSIIGSANINMMVKNSEIINPAEKQLLDCNIKLIRNRPNIFNFGTEGTNSGGRFGIGLNSAIQNRNLFKGAEVLSLKIRTSAELQGSLNNPDIQASKYFLFFNAIEGGAEVSLDFPRIIIPYRTQYQQNLLQSRTSLSAGLGFEFKPEYKRWISTASWSYKWNKNERVKHIFTPIEFNYIKISPFGAFKDYLQSLKDPQYKSQFTDHLLTTIRYSTIISNMGITKTNNQFFLRMNAESSGNTLYMADKFTNKQVNDSGYYTRLGVRYSQYFRFDYDFRKYWKMRFGNSIAFRFMGGIAIPYGNSESVPFEKSFWLGGANDMRGWRLRSLGPGGYADSIKSYDKTGNIMLQSSIEHRFPIYSFLQGSLFIDAGNVWLRSRSNDFKNGEFKLNTFYKQIAMDIGLGLRFDFSFFIFRLDTAVPIKNPSFASGWFDKEEFKLQNSVVNFGIGYPF